jgi:hypothetical protein
MNNTEYLIVKNAILKLNQSRDVLVAQKKELENEFFDLKRQISGRWLPNYEHDKLTKRQSELRIQMLPIERGLAENKRQLREKNALLDEYNLSKEQNVKIPILEGLQALKANYLDFAADRSRVSSMRAMAAQVADELDRLIKTGK